MSYKIQQLIDDNKVFLGDGLYLELCNANSTKHKAEEDRCFFKISYSCPEVRNNLAYDDEDHMHDERKYDLFMGTTFIVVEAKKEFGDFLGDQPVRSFHRCEIMEYEMRYTQHMRFLGSHALSTIDPNCDIVVHSLLVHGVEKLN